MTYPGISSTEITSVWINTFESLISQRNWTTADKSLMENSFGDRSSLYWEKIGFHIRRSWHWQYSLKEDNRKSNYNIALYLSPRRNSPNIQIVTFRINFHSPVNFTVPSNERQGFPNHRRLDLLLNSIFRLTEKRSPKGQWCGRRFHVLMFSCYCLAILPQNLVCWLVMFIFHT